MGYEFKKVEPIYTGGGIYCFTGEFKEGFFLAESCNFDVRLVNDDPSKYSFDEEVCYEEWQEPRLIRDLLPHESLDFLEEMFKWVEENSPEGNYLMDDMRILSEEIPKLRKTEYFR